MAKHGGFNWVFNSLGPSALIFDEIIYEAIEERLREKAEEIEEYMKAEAPWEDETGAAREGLTAEADGHSIVLSHSVDYGIWLEVRWSGQFAIIIPTLERYGPEVMGALGGTMEVSFA